MKEKIVCKFSEFKEAARGFRTALANAVRENPAMVAGLAVAAGAAALGTPHAVLAWTAPSSGDPAYDVYDVALKILQGPIGFVGGLITMAVGGYMIVNPKSGSFLTEDKKSAFNLSDRNYRSSNYTKGYKGNYVPLPKPGALAGVLMLVMGGAFIKLDAITQSLGFIV